MEQQIKQWLIECLRQIAASGLDDVVSDPEIRLPKSTEHGDYTTNIALIAAQGMACNPRELAGRIIDASPLPNVFERVEIAGPGFINIYLKDYARVKVIADILDKKEQYAHQLPASKGRALVEFVSANPTGPLHIGHGRGAAYGVALVNLLTASGYQTDSEYYVNDKGRQMDILVLSVWLRYLDLCGESVEYPKACYQGDYVWDIAADVHRQHQDRLACSLADVCSTQSDDAEQVLDDMIASLKNRLSDDFVVLFDQVLQAMLDSIRAELKSFGITYTRWFFERAVITDDAIRKALKQLEAKGMTYRKDGALWFKSSAMGDEKDRVMVRANGQATYFASDIAYHIDKYQRGYDLMVNVWGADHHGYAPRITAAIKAAGFDDSKLQIVLLQFVNLLQEGQVVNMSTRSGEFQPLSALRKEVGTDAARMFYLTCRYNQHLDFDVALAKSRTTDNPVFYIQYAYARVCSVLKRLSERHYEYTQQPDQWVLLTDQKEADILRCLLQYPGILKASADEREPQILLAYLRTLAAVFHSYYNSCQILVDDEGLRNARLALVQAVGQLIKNGLKILGVTAPETM